MKLSIMLLMAGMAIANMANATTKLYIIPANADGKVEKEGTGYKGQIEMTQSPDDENQYLASNVNIANGSFAIYGINEANGRATFYGPLNWAVTPLPVNYPTPLAIERDGTTIQLPAGGTYDFEFHDRDTHGISYHMLLPRPVAVENDVKYPSKLFLVSSGDKYVELAGDQSTGIYRGNIAVPEDFRISYEPKFDVEAFIFGPTTATDKVVWHENERIPVAYMKGTTAVFESDGQARTADPSDVVVNLPEGYLLINGDTVLGVEGIAADAAPARYYDLSGMPLKGAPQTGFYIRVEGGRATKVFAR